MSLLQNALLLTKYTEVIRLIWSWCVSIKFWYFQKWVFSEIGFLIKKWTLNKHRLDSRSTITRSYLWMKFLRMRDNIIIVFKCTTTNLTIKVLFIRVNQIVRLQVRHARFISSTKFAFKSGNTIGSNIFRSHFLFTLIAVFIGRVLRFVIVTMVPVWARRVAWLFAEGRFSDADVVFRFDDDCLTHVELFDRLFWLVPQIGPRIINYTNWQ